MYHGIAIGGKKFAGKDLILDYLMATRANPVVIRCKTPIVEAYERIVGHPYDKGRDDAELIHISKTQIRANGNDGIVGDYLRVEVPKVLARGQMPLIPDMRRKPENDAIYDLGLLCIKIEASDDVRAARGMRRDGTLKNWVPDDDTERDVDEQRYHYIIDNNKDDDGQFAIYQLEEFLRRAGARFGRIEKPVPYEAHVRIIDPNSPHYFMVGFVCDRREGMSRVQLPEIPNDKSPWLYNDQLMVIGKQVA